MENTKQILNSRSIDYRKQTNLTSIDYRTIVTSKQADEIINQAIDLISNQDFRPFFFKTLYLIGPTDFYEAMDYARKQDVKCQPCIFVKRLKEYRDRISV